MLLLSAQPDEFYFLWQLQLQLYNFRLLGIKPSEIHVLIGFNPRKGLSQEFQQLIVDNKAASFFAYPDRRKSKKYLSSLRPHIIMQHFRTFPELENEVLFYHDSDIVFSRLPDFTKLSEDEVWYVSDTHSYISANHIISAAGDKVFQEMCKISGIAPAKILANDSHAGGAQYVLKKCPASFWEKMEVDCEAMYKLLSSYNAKQKFSLTKNSQLGIQAWCTDMWVLWWNALQENREVRIHKELDFCWADSPLEEWESKKILHYTGKVQDGDSSIFRKVDYVFYPPFYQDFSLINNRTCSAPLINIIRSYNKEEKKKRHDLSDVTFLISLRIDSPERKQNIYTIIHYLTTWFCTNILLVEADIEKKIGNEILPEEVQYFFCKDDDDKFYHTKYNNFLLLKATTPIVAFYDTDVVFPISQLLEAVNVIRNGTHVIASPYGGICRGVDSLLKEMFVKLLDPFLLEANQNKLKIYAKRALGGAIFLDRLLYLKAGMDNEKIDRWGPEDVERVKRMEILGYPIKRIPGDLYHLPHFRGDNSGYQSEKEHAQLMGEFLRICSMKKTELEAYVQTWN